MYWFFIGYNGKKCQNWLEHAWLRHLIIHLPNYYLGIHTKVVCYFILYGRPNQKVCFQIFLAIFREILLILPCFPWNSCNFQLGLHHFFREIWHLDESWVTFWHRRFLALKNTELSFKRMAKTEWYTKG